MLNVALIGLGADWETWYAPSLQNLQRRLRIRGLFSAVGTLADQAGVELGCTPSSGIRSLIARSDIRGVLVLDPGLCSLYPLELAIRYGKPVFLGQEALDLACQRPEFRQRIAGDSMITPSCGWRYHPATARLRELLVTRLGRPHEIRISVSGTSGVDSRQSASAANGLATVRLADLIDWCRFLYGTAPQSVQALPTAGTEGRQAIHLDFLSPASGGPSPRASVECPVDPSGAGIFPAGSTLRMEVHCQRGMAVLTGPNDIAWEDANGTEIESLQSDRTAVDVMLDHFARRALGGLIPTPTLEDILLAQDLVARAEESLRMRRPLSA